MLLHAAQVAALNNLIALGITLRCGNVWPPPTETVPLLIS
jgi:hypothetical protein